MSKGTYTRKDTIDPKSVKDEMKASTFARKDSYGETKAQMEKLTETLSKFVEKEKGYDP